MASFPKEIITEILSRLPVKSLLRFTTVCKSWKSLIQNPNFIKLHLNQTLISSSDLHLITCQKSIYISDLNLESIHNPLSFSELHHPLKSEQVYILGSCNGVLCVSYSNHNNVFLYNPLTNWHRKVPVNRFIDLKTRKEQVIYGFGYDSITDDYKVFSFFQTFRGARWEITYREAQVFSFKCNSWKNVECIPGLDCFQNIRGVYLNEAVYYVVHRFNSFALQLHKSIVKFDFRTDTLSKLECPDLDDKCKHAMMLELNALKGCLCMLVSYFPESEFHQMYEGNDGPIERADFWMMKESWVRLFSIREPRSIGIKYMLSSVVFSSDGRKIMLEVDCSKHGWYDLEDGSFETITTYGHPKDLGCMACCFVGSLVCVVNDKLNLEGGSSGTKAKKKEKRDLDKFLSVGFKLKL